MTDSKPQDRPAPDAVVARLREYSDWDDMRWGQEIDQAADLMETLVNERATLVAEVERLRAERQRMENVVLKCSESGTGHDWVNDPEGPSFCRVCNCDTEAIFDAIVAMLARARAALEETKP